MNNITGNLPVTYLLYILEILKKQSDSLSDAEKFFYNVVHYHVLGDGKAIYDEIKDLQIDGIPEFALMSSLSWKSNKELDLAFSQRLMDSLEWTPHEASNWLDLWLFTQSRPSFALKVLEHFSMEGVIPEKLMFAYSLNKKHDELEKFMEKGGITEGRLRYAIFLGDIKENWHEAIKKLSKNDALETLIKMEYVAKGKIEETAFWATEQNMYSSLGEQNFKDATLFIHASTGEEDFALEQLINLADKPSWAKALAIKTAITLAAKKGEDVMLMKLYHKLHQVAKTDELKGAACLRAAMIADKRLGRYREAEEFYRLALSYNCRPFISKRGLFRMLIIKKAFGEILQLAENTTDTLILSAVASIAEYKLFDYAAALKYTSPSNNKSRAHLFLKLRDWDSLYQVYSSPQCPVHPSIAKIILGIIDAGRGNFDSAFEHIAPVESSAPNLKKLLHLFWKKYNKSNDEIFSLSEEILKNIKDIGIARSLKLVVASWIKDYEPENAAIFIGDYIESGGKLSFSTKSGSSWFEILLHHPNPNAEWFSEYEPGLNNLLDETEKSKEWERHAKLLELKSTIVKGDYNKIDYLLRLAKLYEEALQDINKSTNYYTQILNIDQSHKTALDALARINETNENWDKYLQVIRLSLEANSDKNTKASLYFKYGSILETQFNKIDEALKYYKLAIDASPTSLPALHGIRDIYVKKEHWKGVLNTLKMEASIWDAAKEKAGIYTQMGNILLEKLGKKEQAEIYFSAALKLKPDSSGALRELFKLYYNNENWEKASEIVGSLTKRALSVGTSEERAQFFFERGIVFFHNGENQEAATSFINAIHLDKTNLKPLHSLLSISANYHNPSEFNNFILELEDIYEGESIPDAHSLLSIARAKLNQHHSNSQLALEQFRKASENSKCLIAAIEGEANLLTNMGKGDEAYERWKEFYNNCKKSPDYSNGCLKMARFLSYRLDKSREAQTILRGVLQKDNSNEEAFFELATELFANGQKREAMVTIDRLLTLTKNQEGANRTKYLIMALLIRYESGEIKKSDMILNNLDINDLSPYNAVVVSYILAKKKDLNKAYNILKKVKINNSEDREYIDFHKALLSSLVNNKNHAIDLLSKIEKKNSETKALLCELSLESSSERQKLDYLELLRDEFYDDCKFLQLMEKSVNDTFNHQKRIFQVRSLFDPSVPIAPEPIPFIKNNAMASDEYRSKIGVKDSTGPAAQMWLAIQKGLETIFPPTDPQLPNARMAKGKELLIWEEIEAVFGYVANLWVADLTTKPVLIIPSDDKPQIVTTPALFKLPESSVRFVLGRALEASRSGYSLLFHISREQRLEIFSVMYSLALPKEEHDETAKKFLSSLERKYQKAIERVSSSAWEIFPSIDLNLWLDSVELALDKAGLLLSGDPLGTLQGSNFLNNLELEIYESSIANFALAPRAGELLSSYISEGWNEFYETTPESSFDEFDPI